MKQPNILLLMADQWRADCLGFAGHPVVETPHLDELFTEGIHFPQAYSSCPTCIPARVALLTGLSQRTHGRTRYEDGVPWEYPITLPGLLAGAGYHTQCVGKMHVHPSRSLMGFHHVVLHDGDIKIQRLGEKDFDRTDDYRRWLREHAHGQAEVRDTGLGCNSWGVAEWPYAEHLHPTNWVASQSIDFLRRRDPTKPFFLKASFVRPHPPFDPPAQFLRRYDSKILPSVAMGDWVECPENDQRGLRVSFGRGRVDPPQAERARRAYFALITHIDAQINRILLELKDQEEDDNTLIVFLSDHGELLGDHLLWAKAMAFDGSARVPLVVRPPKTWNLPGGRACHDLVELRDILPTFCQAAGADIPDSIDGFSFLPQVQGERSPNWRKDLHGEHEFGEESNHWLTDGKEKYVYYPLRDQELLFDLTADPREEKNLTAERPDRVAYWHCRLKQELG